MRLILILLSFGIFTSAISNSKDSELDLEYADSNHRPSRGIFHGVDLRNVLAAIEPNYAQQYVIAQPLVQQYTVPVQVAPTLQFSQPAQVQDSYSAPRQQQQQQQQYAAPEVRQNLNSVAVSSAQQSAPASSQQNYNAPQPIQPPPREYSLPKRDADVSQVYSAPAYPNSAYSISSSQASAQASAPSNNYGPPAKYEEYGLPSSARNPNNQYGAPPPVQVSAPQQSQSFALPSSPSQSYGSPAPQVNSAYGAPAPQVNSAYGAPAPQQVNSGYLPPAAQVNSAYGAPNVNSFGGGASLGGLGFGGGGGGGGGFDVSKDVSIHVPPQEDYDYPQRIPVVYNRSSKKARKNYKIIFIKAPAPPPAPIPEIPEIEPEPEQKTLVYVLVPKPEAPKAIIIPTPAPAPKSQPEVYYVKYRQAVNSNDAVFGGGGGEENLERGSPLGTANAQSGGGQKSGGSSGY